MQSSARPLPAAIIPLADLLHDHVGAKIRTAGMTLAYDPPSQLGLVSHRSVTLLVDFSLVAPTSFEVKAKIMMMGNLEHTDEELPVALQSPLAKVPTHIQSCPKQGLILRATLMRPCPDLDFDVWEEAARRESMVRWEEAQKRSR